MKNLKLVLTSIFRLLVITGIILLTYLVVGVELGAIIFIAGSILLLIVFIMALIGSVKGKSRVFKKAGRFKLVLILTDTVAAMLILLVAFSVTTLVQEEVGLLSAKDKIAIVRNAFSSDKNKVNDFTQAYPVLETDNIIFRYHPDTEKSVEKMTSIFTAVEDMEKDIYGKAVDKSEPLEVIVLRDADDYFTLNPNADTMEGGHYNSYFKRAMLYEDDVSENQENFHILEVFAHEYSHYLMDIFLEEEDLDWRDVPVWFDEGVAELMSYRTVPAHMLPEGKIFDTSFLDLHTHDEWDKSESKVDTRNYDQSYLAVLYLLDSQDGDLSFISDLLKQQSEASDFEEAFNKMTGTELAALHESVSWIENKRSLAWDSWSMESDYEEAEVLYKEILQELPAHSDILQNYAMMLEQSQNWDAAIKARKEHTKVNPTANSLLNLSYMLLFTDSKEALTQATKAVEAAEKEPYDYLDFYEQWMEDAGHYHQLMKENRPQEAYDFIMESEHADYFFDM
ncbi:collagenase [Alkalibacterium kapii]|uniref:Uncharacterized protein n=1 Tax=Alkalibacterium kapii TaxID=426704 RepID=A0A511AUJ1_9LACT|nr:collagenase [Alkalibacterium kapii]GEK91804.1 hypothetical protein AKA01nite_14260 [Alkalibacterium kapii]